jgi:peroxiredoxin (alkyl hydroperoxide reductase subunit C)
MFIQVGKPAPEFTVETVLGDEVKKVSLAEFKGKKWVVIFFYPLDFTFVCPTEIIEMSDKYEEFQKLNAEVLGGSIDSIYSHKSWLKELGKLHYPLFSDITRDMSRDYGVLIEEKGHTLRGTFIVDPEGVLRYHLVHDLTVGRSADETLRVLQSLQTGELCPANWKKGQKTLGKA